jgi:hypothetical protein
LLRERDPSHSRASRAQIFVALPQLTACARGMTTGPRAVAQLASEFLAKAVDIILDARASGKASASSDQEKTNRWVSAPRRTRWRRAVRARRPPGR